MVVWLAMKFPQTRSRCQSDRLSISTLFLIICLCVGFSEALFLQVCGSWMYSSTKEDLDLQSAKMKEKIALLKGLPLSIKDTLAVSCSSPRATLLCVCFAHSLPSTREQLKTREKGNPKTQFLFDGIFIFLLYFPRIPTKPLLEYCGKGWHTFSWWQTQTSSPWWPTDNPPLLHNLSSAQSTSCVKIHSLKKAWNFLSWLGSLACLSLIMRASMAFTMS